MKNRFLSLALLTATFTAAASNLGFLKDAPITHMDSTDTALMAETIQRSLTDSKDNEPASWENQNSGSKGTVTPLKTYDAYNTSCRRLRIQNEAGGESASSEFDFCLTKEGEWKVLK